MELYQKKLYFINGNLYRVVRSMFYCRVDRSSRGDIRKMGMMGCMVQPNFSVATPLVGML